MVSAVVTLSDGAGPARRITSPWLVFAQKATWPLVLIGSWIDRPVIWKLAVPAVTVPPTSATSVSSGGVGFVVLVEPGTLIGAVKRPTWPLASVARKAAVESLVPTGWVRSNDWIIPVVIPAIRTYVGVPLVITRAKIPGPGVRPSATRPPP